MQCSDVRAAFGPFRVVVAVVSRRSCRCWNILMVGKGSERGIVKKNALSTHDRPFCGAKGGRPPPSSATLIPRERDLQNTNPDPDPKYRCRLERLPRRQDKLGSDSGVATFAPHPVVSVFYFHADGVWRHVY